MAFRVYDNAGGRDHASVTSADDTDQLHKADERFVSDAQMPR